MATLDVGAPARSPSEHQVQLRGAAIASTVGTAIGPHGFFLYGIFLFSIVTGLVFAKLFFPHSDPLVGTLAAFATFAVASVPTHESIGTWGAVILTMLRFIQDVRQRGDDRSVLRRAPSDSETLPRPE